MSDLNRILGGPHCKGCASRNEEWEKRQQAHIDAILAKAFKDVQPLIEKEREAENVADIMNLVFGAGAIR